MGIDRWVRDTRTLQSLGKLRVFSTIEVYAAPECPLDVRAGLG
jgi:hypothetical protein